MLEKCKAKLRAALEKDLSSEEAVDHEKRSRRREKDKKKKKKKKKAARSRNMDKEDGEDSDVDSSPSRSPSSSSTTSESTDTDSSRDHSRDRRKQRRQKRSKFSLEKFTKGRKYMKSLNYNELKYSICMWGSKRAKKAGMDVDTMMSYLGHLTYMSIHAISNNYSDEAYHGYDHAICEKAKEKGLQAFKMGDNGLSLLHFNMDNSKSYREARKGRVGVVASKADWSRLLCLQLQQGRLH